MSVRAQVQRTVLLWLVGMSGVAVLLAGAHMPPSVVARTHLGKHALLVVASLENGALLSVTVVIGALTAPRVGLISLIGQSGSTWQRRVRGIPLYLFLGGLGGAAVTLADQAFTHGAPALSAFNQANAGSLGALNLGLWQRILYGGITEEIVFRWGFMSLIAWICFKALRSREVALPAAVVLSALLLTFIQLPALGELVHHLPRSVAARLVALNLLLGIAFGFVYARNSLEAAMATHVAFHVGTLGISALLAA